MEEYMPSGMKGRDDIDMTKEEQEILEPLLYGKDFSEWLGPTKADRLENALDAVAVGIGDPQEFCSWANELANQAAEAGFDAPFFSYLESEQVIDIIVHPVAIKARALDIASDVSKLSFAQRNALIKWVSRGRVFFRAWLEDHPEVEDDSIWMGATFAMDQLEAALHPVVA